MSDPDSSDELAQPVRVLQIIVAAMVLGTLTFLVVTVVLRATGQVAGVATGSTPVVTYLAIAVAIGALLIRRLVTTAIVRSGEKRLFKACTEARASTGTAGAGDQRRSLLTTELVRVFTATTIAGAAMVEGSAFFVLVAYLLEGKPVALAIGAVLIVGLAFQFPTRSSVADWIDAGIRRLQDPRALEH